MEHRKATTQDILGEQCRHYEKLTFDSCRDCNGRDYRCQNYLSQQTKPITYSFSTVHETTGTDKTADVHYPLDYTECHPATFNFRESDYVPMILRTNKEVISKTRKVLDWIREATDGMVI
ncbi:MAG TPA: hypothetical protein VIR31_04495 [Nitrososphaeraceae archaeon]